MDKKELRDHMEVVRGYVQEIGKLTFRIMPRGWKKVYLGYFLSREEEELDLQAKVTVTGVKGYGSPMEAARNGDSAEVILSKVRDQFRELRDRCEEIDDIWYACALAMSIHGDYNIFFFYEPFEDPKNLDPDTWIQRVGLP